MKRVAIIEGGYSMEKAVSLKSAKTVFENLDRSKYNLTKVFIDKNEWVAYDEDGRYPIDKNDFTFLKHGTKIKFDTTFIMIHGSPGEDGKLQGYFDMLGIPYNTPSAAITSLTFQKYHCNQFLKNFGVNVANAVLIRAGDEIDEQNILEEVKLPCFVKPTDGGSSYGVTKVKMKSELHDAITLAFQHGSQVMVEAFIAGREVTNGVYRLTGTEIKVLPITEIISNNEFFDYEAKYKGQSLEVTPAKLNMETTNNIKSLTRDIYNTLGMNGIVRIDYIINCTDNEPYLLEINTVPGQSPESIIPQMAKFEGINLTEMYGISIESSWR